MVVYEDIRDVFDEQMHIGMYALFSSTIAYELAIWCEQPVYAKYMSLTIVIIGVYAVLLALLFAKIQNLQRVREA